MTKAWDRAHWIQLVVGVIVGAIIGGGSTFFTMNGRISKLEGIVSQLETGSPPPTTNTIPELSSNAKPEQLIPIIQDQQRKHVKESWGEFSHQSFTMDDLKRFIDNKTTTQIIESLKRDPNFLDVVLAIRELEPGDLHS